jgi:hemerythrin-like domain-containing protein
MTTITMNEIIHAAVRRDLARTEAALRAFPDGDRPRAEALKRAWDFLAQTLHDHHVGEDEHVWPYLRSLGGVDPALADQMEAEHVVMAAAMSRASASMNEFVASASQTSAETAADSVAAAAAVTAHHLDHEEEAVMPVIVAQMHTAGWKAVEKQLRTGNAGDAGRFFAWLQDGMEPAIATALAGTVPAPVRFVLSRVMGRRYRREIAPAWR